MRNGPLPRVLFKGDSTAMYDHPSVFARFEHWIQSTFMATSITYMVIERYSGQDDRIIAANLISLRNAKQCQRDAKRAVQSLNEQLNARGEIRDDFCTFPIYQITQDTRTGTGVSQMIDYDIVVFGGGSNEQT